MPAASNTGCERKMDKLDNTSRMRHLARDVGVEVFACPNTAADPPPPAEVSNAASACENNLVLEVANAQIAATAAASGSRRRDRRHRLYAASPTSHRVATSVSLRRTSPPAAVGVARSRLAHSLSVCIVASSSLLICAASVQDGQPCSGKSLVLSRMHAASLPALL